MSEDVRPFEEYKEMIKDMRKEEMIKGLYDLSKNITEKGKEIEKLRKTLKEIYSLTLVIDSKIMRKEYAQANKFNHIVRDKIEELKEVGKE